MSLLLDPQREQDAQRPSPGKTTYARRRAGLLVLLAVAVATGVLGLRALTGTEHSPFASTGGPAFTGANAVRTLRADHWQGYATRRAPRRERFRMRFSGGPPPAAGMVFDVRTGEVLWERRARTRRPIASLTKMMTALIAADSLPRDSTVPITREVLDFEGSGVGMFRRGERVDEVTMLYGLLLPSGNDAAIALALRVAGTQRAFVALMNRTARRMGLTCTRFASPSGIVDQGNYSCARDLARLSREVLARPLLRRIVGTQYTVRRQPLRKRPKLYLANNNTLMTRGYAGVTGVKTGYTEAAGSCLVATVRRGRRHLGLVLLASPNTGDQGAQLFDTAFARLASR